MFFSRKVCLAQDNRPGPDSSPGDPRVHELRINFQLIPVPRYLASCTVYSVHCCPKIVSRWRLFPKILVNDSEFLVAIYSSFSSSSMTNLEKIELMNWQLTPTEEYLARLFQFCPKLTELHL